MRTTLLLLLAAMSVVLLAGASTRAAATQPAVMDNAGFFSSDAVAATNRQLAELREKTGRTMRVETFDRMPNELQVQARDHRDLMRQWARDRAQEAGLGKGVFVLISRDPSSLHAEVLGNAVSRAEHQKLLDTLLEGFKAKEYDRGLTQAVELFAQGAPTRDNAGAGAETGSPPVPYSLPDSSPAPAPGATPTRNESGDGINWGSILLWAALIIGGVWLLRKLFGGRREPTYSYGRGPNQPTGYPPGQDPGYDPRYGGGGGAFGRGVGGGLLGGLLGSWIGHQVFRGHDNPASAAPPPTDPGAGGDPQQADLGNHSGGGEDFGGGGDFGGGDDFGGGGDF